MLSVLPVLSCLVADGGHPIVPDPPIHIGENKKGNCQVDQDTRKYRLGLLGSPSDPVHDLYVALGLAVAKISDCRQLAPRERGARLPAKYSKKSESSRRSSERGMTRSMNPFF